MTRRLSRLVKMISRDPRSGGFTLIEIMVATLLFLVVMAGVVPFFLGGLSHASAARHKSVATNIAREKLEAIRQLDYREIVEDEANPSDPRNLSVRFGTTEFVPERNMTFSIDYDVEELRMTSGQGASRSRSRGMLLPLGISGCAEDSSRAIPGSEDGVAGGVDHLKDNLDAVQTPFPVLRTDGVSTNIRCHIAESDWFLAYSSLVPPLPSPNDIFLKYLFRDEAGIAAKEYEVDSSGLVAVVNDGAVQEIYFRTRSTPAIYPTAIGISTPPCTTPTANPAIRGC